MLELESAAAIPSAAPRCPDEPVRLWFTKGLSQTGDALALIRDGDSVGRFRLLASHTEADNPVLERADEAILEPRGIAADEYPDWVLETALRHRVSIVVAQRRPQRMGTARDRFAAAGIHLQTAATPDMLRLLNDKGLFYTDAQARGLPVTPFRCFGTAPEFVVSHAEMRDLGLPLCIKPSFGIYGNGFHPLVERVDLMKRILDPDDRSLTAEEFRVALEMADGDRTWVIMQLLEGPEHSIDVLARQGVVVRAASRRKLDGGRRELRREGPELQLAADVVRRYGLDGIVNVQTRAFASAPNVPLLLEVNARMAGGIGLAAKSGINLPYLWAQQLVEQRHAIDAPAVLAAAL